MIVSEDRTIADVVNQNIKAADVFKKYGIDFCCGGGLTIQKACDKNEIDYRALESELKGIGNNIPRAFNYNKWELDFLVDHIQNIHHTYVEESIPILLQYANKVAKVHGHHYAEVVKINELVKEVAQELAAHMKKEELILFPYVKQLVLAKNENKKTIKPHFGSVDNPINMMENEHETAGEIFKEIADLTNDFTSPANACNTFKALYAKLQEFEQDLHQHIHLENNILFPKSIKLEKQLSLQ
ncbi:MAG: iron-sulfur cluster repair di-iron protein [Bacteroidetes bacterium MedPE-SWsnd-G1]|nr:MAG: iron-sulfur cluster repair di-iron protein [Bacteroidetes bacterium MedPE-SWsnd-G1]